MFAKQEMSQSTGILTLRQVRAVCTQREPTGRVIIVIVAERGEREEREKTREGREKERRDKRRDRKKDRQKEERESTREEKAEHPSMCRFKTPPCVRSGRLRVYLRVCPENACMFNTCGRFPGTHGSVLNAHTEAF